jgi:hypothetical protein
LDLIVQYLAQKINCMKKILALCFVFLAVLGFAQDRINPSIKKAGGIFDVPDAVEKPDPNLDYKIVIELWAPADNPKELHQSVNNIARLINLHVMGGVPKEKLDIVVAIHGEATYTITDSKTYEKRYKGTQSKPRSISGIVESWSQVFCVWPEPRCPKGRAPHYYS